MMTNFVLISDVPGSLEGLFEALVIIVIIIIPLYISVQNDNEKRSNAIKNNDLVVYPRTMEEAKIIKERNIRLFKEKFPNYKEQFSDEMVDEIIGCYVHLRQFGYKQKYDQMVEQGLISQEWFNAIVTYAVLEYEEDRRRNIKKYRRGRRY